MPLRHLIGLDLEALLAADPSQTEALWREYHPEDIADVIHDLDDAQAVALLTRLPTEYAAQVFARLEEERQHKLAQGMDPNVAANLVIEMDADERTDFFSVIPPSLGETLLHEIEVRDPQVAVEVQELSRWPDSSAGSLMTTDYISLNASLTMAQAIRAIRAQAAQAESVDVAFVFDGEGQLAGVLPLRQVLTSEEDERVEAVMRRGVISVPPEMDQEEVARRLAKYDLGVMPVVDAEGRLLGVITSDDVMDVMTVEQDEDVQKLGAMEPLTDGYFETKFWQFIRKRGLWLLVLFVGGFGTTQAMQAYESTLASLTQLSFYLPLLISTGGNSGAQSSTLIIRGLATGDVGVSDWGRVFSRELLQGLTLGALLAPLGIARAVLMGDGLALALLVGATIIVIVIMGCLIGSLTPLVLHALKIDPATSSTPLIATVVDLLGVVFYLGLARFLLAELLPRALGA